MSPTDVTPKKVLDVPSHGQCVPWTTRLLDTASLGRCGPDRFFLNLDHRIGVSLSSIRTICPNVSGLIGQRHIVRGTPRSWDGSSKGRLVQGTARPRDGSSKGRLVQGTPRPRDASSKGRLVQWTLDSSSVTFRSWTHRSGTKYNIAPLKGPCVSLHSTGSTPAQWAWQLFGNIIS